MYTFFPFSAFTCEMTMTSFISLFVLTLLQAGRRCGLNGEWTPKGAASLCVCHPISDFPLMKLKKSGFSSHHKPRQLFCLFSLSSQAEDRAGDGWMDVFSSASHRHLKAPQHILEMCDPGGIMEMANTFRKQSANIRNRTIHVIDQTSAYALCINRHLCQHMRTNGPGVAGRREFSSFPLKTNHKHYISSAAFPLRLLPQPIRFPKYRLCLLRRFVSFEMFPMRHSTYAYCVCSTAQPLDAAHKWKRSGKYVSFPFYFCLLCLILCDI